MSLLSIIGEGVGITRVILQHVLRPSSDKLKDDRYKELKGWQKYKAIAKEEQAKRKKKLENLKKRLPLP